MNVVKAGAQAAVVIPSWNTVEYLARCVASVRDQTDVDIELLVVDSGSEDGSIEFLRRAEIAHIGLPKNMGFAHAVNLGARNTSAPMLLVLNGDVVLARGCLRALVDKLGADSSLAGVQPKIVVDGSNPATIDSAGQALTTAGSEYELGAGCLDGPEYWQAREVFGVCGAVCLLRRELFSTLGGYDERLFAFYEDVDLNARARLAGWRFAYVADAEASHTGHASWTKQDRARAFNVRLSVQNRAAVGVKVLPAGSLPWVLVSTARSLVAAPFKGTGRAVLAGTVGFLSLLPQLLRERRWLRAGGGSNLDQWLTKRRIDPIGAKRRGLLMR